MKSGYQAYNSTSVDTADQGKLILIAYDVAIKHCKMSLGKFGKRELIEERTRHLFKAQDAVSELMAALNLDAGEVAKNLYRLYEYILHRLVQANINSEASPVEEVVRHLESLRGAWNQAILSLKREAAPPVAAVAQQNFAVTV